jgi:hypothetical protein
LLEHQAHSGHDGDHLEEPVEEIHLAGDDVITGDVSADVSAAHILTNEQHPEQHHEEHPEQHHEQHHEQQHEEHPEEHHGGHHEEHQEEQEHADTRHPPIEDDTKLNEAATKIQANYKGYKTRKSLSLAGGKSGSGK